MRVCESVCVCVSECACESVCVCVCACVRTRAKLRCARYRDRECNVETEMTRPRVNKINNTRLFSLFNKRTRCSHVL